jgi:hypothetical protein
MARTVVVVACSIVEANATSIAALEVDIRCEGIATRNEVTASFCASPPITSAFGHVYCISSW